jgi:hypothetical protein
MNGIAGKSSRLWSSLMQQAATAALMKPSDSLQAIAMRMLIKGQNLTFWPFIFPFPLEILPFLW